MTLGSFDLDRIGGRAALDALVSEVLAAGDAARRLWEAGRAHATRKPDRSPVTEADHLVEARLAAFLAARFPRTGFLGEEGGEGGATGAALRWVVDPIDGTRAFVRGMRTWSVLVALVEHGEPVVGIAYLPADEDLYVGVRGGGALGNGRPLRVSTVASLADAAVTHGALLQFAGEPGARALAALRDATDTQRGYADFDGYRHVLRGQADAMVDPDVKPWDVAAACLLVREAGGAFTTLRGAPDLDGVVADGGALASNGLVHAALLAALSAP